MSVNEIERYAKVHRRLHPEVVEEVQRFFNDLQWDVNRVQVRIEQPWWKWWHRTKMYVRGMILVCEPNYLNHPEGMDLSLPGSFSNLCHECFHVYQWDTYPGATWFGKWFWGWWKGVQEGHAYYHPYIEIEQEAKVFQREVIRQLNPDNLLKFRTMR